MAGSLGVPRKGKLGGEVKNTQREDAKGANRISCTPFPDAAQPQWTQPPADTPHKTKYANTHNNNKVKRELLLSVQTKAKLYPPPVNPVPATVLAKHSRRRPCVVTLLFNAGCVDRYNMSHGGDRRLSDGLPPLSAYEWIVRGERLKIPSDRM